MTLTLLFDLDDTLLRTNLEAFVPAYFQALSTHLAPYVEPEKMLRALIAATRRMVESTDPACTLQDVFEADFYARLGLPKQALVNALDVFYAEVFSSLQSITSPTPGAVSLIDWAASKGYRIAIATDPFFPRTATLQRIRWAGFEPQQFELISTFENFHFSKTYPAYYAEVLGQIGWPDGPVLMIGNDLDRDILPAQKLGLATYQVDAESASGSGPEAGARGNLADLRPWLESTDLSRLVPSIKTPDSIKAVLLSSPAALSTLCETAEPVLWQHQPRSEDWGLTELACHLRDTEREINQMQLKLLKEQAEPFIPRPDTSVWASQRNYVNENGPEALEQFTQARMETLAALQAVSDADWNRKARHAIFGPTNFLEVVGFMADHDRMHIQQAWKTVHPD